MAKPSNMTLRLGYSYIVPYYLALQCSIRLQLRFQLKHLGT